MGRKPNQLVLEYFDRGAKLEDNSNRYVHTCKACGKNFPKGRIESLIAHVEKSCSNIRREDRIRILSLARSSPQPVQHQDSNNANALNHLWGRTLGEYQFVQPVSSSRSLSGLEALAEASRQLEHPEKPGINQHLPGSLIDPNLDKAYSLLRSSDSSQSLTGNGDHNPYPTVGTFGSNAFTHPTTAEPQATSANMLQHDEELRYPTTLSLIAASASDLEARLPPINEDREQLTAIQASSSQQSGPPDAPMVNSGNKNSCTSVDNPISGAALTPVLDSLPGGPRIRSKLELRSIGQTRVSEKTHGRAQKVRGVFRKLASCNLERLRGHNPHEQGECIIKFAAADCDLSPLSFSAQLDQADSVVCVDQTPDQVSSKLLPYMRATVSHPSYEEPPLLSNRTFGIAVRSEDTLLAQSFDLWSLTQAITSGPDHWDISVKPRSIRPEDQRQLSGQAGEASDIVHGSSQFRQIITAQLQAAAEQGACDISKHIMVELEKRLERKERCQGFETFFVGIILLNCVERMSWAMERASRTEEAKDWPLGRPLESYMDQDAHFAEFLSKLFQMRGILANVKQIPEGGMLLGSHGNAPIVDEWLGELQFTSKSLEERRGAQYDESDHRCFDFRFASSYSILSVTFSPSLLTAVMDEEVAAAQSLLFSQVHFVIVQSQLLKLSDAEVLARQLVENGAQEHTISNPNGKIPLKEITHIISATPDFVEYDAATAALKSVVKPDWVTASVTKGRLANPRSYSPDPRLFFSGLVVCCADIPEGDKDAIMGGVLATGGLYSSSVTKQVTHIVALTMDHEKCQTVLKKDLKCKIVLPHWFDDCLRIGKRLDEDPYMFPNPDIMHMKPRDPIPQTNQIDMQGASSTQPIELPRALDSKRVATRRVDVFKGKKVMLCNDLNIGSELRATIEDLVDHSGGTVTSAVQRADMLICHYRESSDYRVASRAHKEVGNLAWLYYLITYNSWISPMKRLLYYPISKNGLPGFNQFRISLSNYNGEARVYLENLAIAAGGEFTKTMKEDNTHLITAHQYSEKCDAAREWNINMVNHLWLEESYAKWQIQTLSNPRYTYFPPRTNLSDVVGQTPIDKHAVEKYFFASGTVEESEGGEVRRLNAKTLQKHDRDSGPPGSSQDFVPYRTRPVDGTPTASRTKKTSGPLKTPVTTRIVIDGKENETPSTTSSRGAKDRAAAKLHDQAADIALYEKERKRVGGVIFGGRRQTSEDAVSDGSRKRSNSKDEGETHEVHGRDKKRPKTNKLPPPTMRLLLTGYKAWDKNGKKEAEDKSRLRDLGVLVTQDPSHCTHLASPAIVRTKKFVCALARAPMVISTEFVDDCLAKDEWREPEDYILNDPIGEQRVGFKLSEAVSRARTYRGQLLRGMPIYCTETVKGGFDVFKAIIEANGGKCLLYKGRASSIAAWRTNGQDEDPDAMDTDEPEYLYLLSGSTPAEMVLWSKFRQMVRGMGKLPRIVQTDWLLNSALRQEVHWDETLEFKEDGVSNGQ
ncbi:MAG: hypothetical protein Q9213_003490 [Squamulea squamosa]